MKPVEIINIGVWEGIVTPGLTEADEVVGKAVLVGLYWGGLRWWIGTVRGFVLSQVPQHDVLGTSGAWLCPRPTVRLVLTQITVRHVQLTVWAMHWPPGAQRLQIIRFRLWIQRFQLKIPLLFLFNSSFQEYNLADVHSCHWQSASNVD